MRRAPHPLIVVRRFLEARRIIGQPVVVAVSGGADSVALLRLLLELREPLGLQLTVGHFDHALRPDSVRDAEWVAALADRLNIPCVIARAGEEPPGTGIEAWARRQRYTWLRGLAQSKQANWVAVAHTADDQAETVLHHILRGTGIAGLAGMPATRWLDVIAGNRSEQAPNPRPSPVERHSTPSDANAGEGGVTGRQAGRPDEGDSNRPHAHTDTIRLIRPCLDIRRSELRDYLATLHQDFLTDPTNDDPRWTRNEIRNDLIPHLRDRFNPRVVQALLSLSRQARDATRVIRRKAAKLLKRSIVQATPECVRLQAGPFASADAAVVREATVRLWRLQRWPRQRMSFRHWAAAAELLRGTGPAGVEWPGAIAGVRRGRLVVLERRIVGQSGV